MLVKYHRSGRLILLVRLRAVDSPSSKSEAKISFHCLLSIDGMFHVIDILVINDYD